MKTWLSIRFENGKATLALRGSTEFGRPGQARNVTATFDIPAGDETAQEIAALCGALVKRFDGDLKAELEIEQARALVNARDRREV